MIRLFCVAIMLAAAFTMRAQSLKVMTYNIRLDHTVDGVNQWPKRSDKVYALIRKYDPDILGIQEALHHQLQDILKNIPEYTSVGVGRDDGKTKGEYSAILFKKDRFAVQQQNTFWLSETPDVAGSKSWDAAITRVATWASLRDLPTKKEFIIVNTHFDHIGTVAREKSAALIKEKIAAAHQQVPVIITGDFNSEPTEAPYKNMLNGEALKLFNSRPATESQGTFCTFTVNAAPCKVIDYIFYTAELTPKNYQVITDHNGTYYPSDHLPVMCIFLWPE
jgi:endonuclease/exonuclease/phosphatase family metal-dependent hydrolase